MNRLVKPSELVKPVAVHGWRGNPAKALGPWSLVSDLDFAVFSVEAIRQAQAKGTPVNRRVVMDNRYVVFKNNSVNGNGFYDTPLGTELRRVVRHWGTHSSSARIKKVSTSS